MLVAACGLIIATSCNNKFVSKSSIQNKKHNKGYHLNLSAFKQKQKKIIEAHTTIEEYGKVIEIISRVEQKYIAPDKSHYSENYIATSDEAYIPEPILANKAFKYNEQHEKIEKEETRYHRKNFKKKNNDPDLILYFLFSLLLGAFMLIGGIYVLSIPIGGISVGGLLLAVIGGAFIIAAFLMLD